ncbi:uncharacterized protein [Panulirus ornatus]|uniref:uncharacterized protein isoform X2 n=1 Tax=Panulirus ornatus TaxID=150431 RepID=UPI003A852F0B
MPVRDAAANLPPNKARSGMFKWMISGHKGHKHKQEKLNNAVSQKNKNNLKQQQQQQEQQEVGSSTPTGEDLPNNALRINEKPVDCGPFAHTNGQLNTSLHQTPELLPQQQQCGDVNQNLEKCDATLSINGLCVSVDNNVPPPLPTSRPPPPPSHPPPPVPPHGQPLPQPPQQPLPPVPGHHQEYPSQAPGTCTLPRRGLVREDPANRFRSPSNPPPASHQPPPYSRHQPPDPFRRSRGPYQPPPPPKMDTRDPRDSRESREQDLRELRSSREPREREGRDVRLSRNLDDTRDADHREARDPRDRDAREHWDGRDFRGSHDPRDHQDPMAVRESRNFRELRESWERRNSNVPRDQSHEDNLRSSSLPRPAPETWVAQNNRWSTREPDSGFDSLTSPAMEGGPRSLPSPGGQNGRTVNPADVPYSQSTEDLLNASRTSPVSVSSATTSSSVSSPSPVQYPTIRAAKQPCVNGASHTSPLSHRSPHESPRPPSGSPRGLGPPHHHSSAVGPPPRPASPEGALLSDSVYPQHDTQPRYAEIPDIIEPRGKDDRLSHRLSRDLRDMRDVRDARDNRDLREAREPKRDTRDPKDKEPRNMRNSSEPRNNNRDTRTSREFRDTSLPRDFRDNRDSRTYLEVRDERHAREAETRGGYRELSVDVEDHDVAESRQERVRGRRDSRQYPPERAEGVKEVRFSSDPSDGLRVRDVPSYDRRDRDADGADGLQMNDDRGSSFQSREARGQVDSRRGDGCTSSSSVSWMEWTQQLQAYVAWVNSQLRKRGRPLISDLRRDLQSGVVFADLIEIISGERVAGISREGESITPQVMRENLDRVLQFMAAKRIRMTHITSKEVAEGNLKSIMRIILALAAHYKPQSVKTSSPPHPQEVAATRPPPQPTTHDVGVGPDVPSTAPEKTPNLSTNRRAMVTGGAGDDQGALMVLRRHPSMTGAPATPRDSSPVYENLPRRVAPNRWAYDSLRASHKFQLSGPHGRRPGPPAMPPKANNLDESSDDAMNTSFNTSFNASLNTSLEGEGADVSSPGRTRPAALNFWQDLTSRRDPASSPPDPPPLPPSQPPPDDPDNPFRYHTIHRMSGRRKLPQIPGAAGPGSRVTTPQEGQESPRVPGDSPLDRNDERPGGGVGDEGSREPEGRSQNSSPATSLVRGPTLDQWSREKNPLDPWEQEDLKGVLRDLNTTRDQLLALQKLQELESASRAGHGPRPADHLVEASPTSVKQELLHLSLARQALEAEKVELTRLLEQREGIITELRKQMHQRDKTIQAQRAHFEDAIRNVQNGKRGGVAGDSPAGRSAVGSCAREELHLVRDAIVSLRSNFRETDPNQHTLDTLEQAIAILIERSGGSGGGGVSGDKTSRAGEKQRPPVNGVLEASTKVIYFTERTVTPFMSTINKRLGEIRLRDFKNMFDRPGLFRFHFKSYDPEYGMVKEEIVNDDDVLPGVDGKIIAWVEEDAD